jgi:5-(carboxyamino)imidazole ribonucleotide mutase
MGQSGIAYENHGDPAMQPLVAVVMGSKSDWGTMVHTVETLEKLGVPCEPRVLSAHRSPDQLIEYVADAEKRGAEVFIAAAGGAAHLAGVIAAKTLLPVLGVPMESKLQGLDSLLSMVQMPAGIPVGTLAIGKAGAINAALFAVAILANKLPQYREVLRKYREEQANAVIAVGDPRT